MGRLDRADRGRLLTVVASLAFGLATREVGLVLDGPTNHLELPAIERLEEMLAVYPGAIVLVTHDDAFAARRTDERWILAGGRISVG